MGAFGSFFGKEGSKRKDSDAGEQGHALEVLQASLPAVAFQVMGKFGFNFPIALSLIHYGTSWVLMAIFKAISLLPAAPLPKSTPFSSLFVLEAVMSFSIGLANISLKHNSVGFLPDG